MERDSAVKIFFEHLEGFLYECETYKKTAERLGVSESCVKSWRTNKRTPNIRSLDKIANHIGCVTYQLIRNHYPIEYGNYRHNDSHIALRKNLETLFIKHQCFSMPQKLSLLHNQVSDLMLISYLRTKNNRLPSLENLDAMAQALGVKTYKLLFWEGYE